MAENRFVLGKISELPEDSMKEFAVGSSKILVLNDKGKIYASGNKCTHYGASLVNGARSGTRVRCPWHGACFDISTGDIEDFPGTDSLASFKVEIEGDSLVLLASPDQVAAAAGKRHRAACGDVDSKQTFVVVGAGAAGASAVESLRDSGFKGRIVLIGKESVPPYDRAKLSKVMNAKIEQIQLRSTEYYTQTLKVDLMLGKEVTELDAEKKFVRLGEEIIKYDAALVATGGSPTRLPIQGINDASNVFVLRTLAEANKLDSLLPDARVVIFGSSFIGMEIAANAVSKAKSVTVVARSDLPFKQSLGDEIGAAFLKLHEKNNVQFIKNSTCKKAHKEGDRIVSLQLDDGREVHVDLVVFGVGVDIKSTTSFVKGVKRDERDGAILCDKNLLAAKDLYVAGDIAKFPDSHRDNDMVRIEHWGVAQNMGKVAGRNMAAGGPVASFNHIPFFWTTQFGKGLRYCGHSAGYDEIIFDKEPNGLEPESLKFLAFYANRGRIIGAASVMRDPWVSRIAEVMHAGRTISASEVKAAISSGKLDELLKI